MDNRFQIVTDPQEQEELIKEFTKSLFEDSATAPEIKNEIAPQAELNLQQNQQLNSTPNQKEQLDEIGSLDGLVTPAQKTEIEQMLDLQDQLMTESNPTQAEEATQPANPIADLLASYRQKMEEAEKRRSSLDNAALIAQLGQGMSNAVATAYGGRGFGEQSPVAQMLRKQGQQGVDDLKKTFSQITTLYNAEQNRKARLELQKLKETAKPEEKLSAFEKEKMKSYAKAAVDWSNKDLPQLDANLQKIEYAIKQLKSEKRGGKGAQVSGPFVGRTPDFLNQLVNPEVVRVRESMQSAIQDTLRPTLGAQFTEKEGERIMNLAFNPTESEEENLRRAELLQQYIKRKITATNALYKHLQENGGSDRGFDYAEYGMRKLGTDQQEQQPQETTVVQNTVLLRAPDGTTKRVRSDAAQKYIDKGAVVVYE